MMAQETFLVAGRRGDLNDMLHSLCQPLTSISLALGIAAAPITEQEREGILRTAQSECLRAMQQVELLRARIDVAHAPATATNAGVQA